MKIDVFTHVTPPKFLAAFEKRISGDICKELPCRYLPSLGNLETRFRTMDKFEGYVQIPTLTNPPIELVAEPAVSLELAKIFNDEMAELIAKYPDRFISGVACLPMNDMDAALKEADRAIKELHLCGVQIYSQIMGAQLDSPDFMPLYEKMAKYDLPIWIHPFFQAIGKVAKDADQFSSYRVFAGKKSPAWEMHRGVFEVAAPTTAALTYLVYSGVFDKYPNIKFITHHCGASIPYFAGRIQVHHDMFEAREGLEHGLHKPILDYYRMFYGDTALHGNVPSLMCGYNLYGASHIVFGTDMPFDAEFGAWATGKTIESIEKMPIPAAEKKLIFEGNIKKLIHYKK